MFDEANMTLMTAQTNKLNATTVTIVNGTTHSNSVIEQLYIFNRQRYYIT